MKLHLLLILTCVSICLCVQAQETPVNGGEEPEAQESRASADSEGPAESAEEVTPSQEVQSRTTVTGAAKAIVKEANGLIRTEPASPTATQLEFDFNTPNTQAPSAAGRALAIVNSGKQKYLDFVRPSAPVKSNARLMNSLSVMQLAVDVWYDSGVGYKIYTTEDMDQLSDAAKRALQNTVGTWQDPLETSKALTKTATGLIISNAPTPLGLISASGKSLSYVSILLDETGQIQELALANYISGIHADAMVAASRVRFSNRDEYHAFVQEYVNAHMCVYVLGSKLFFSYAGGNLRLVAEGGAAVAGFLSRVAGAANEGIDMLFEVEEQIGSTLGARLAENIIGDPYQTGLMSAVDQETRNFLIAKGVSTTSNLGRALYSRMRVLAQDSGVSNSDQVKAGIIANQGRLQKELEYLRLRAAPGIEIQ